MVCKLRENYQKGTKRTGGMKWYNGAIGNRPAIAVSLEKILTCAIFNKHNARLVLGLQNTVNLVRYCPRSEHFKKVTPDITKRICRTFQLQYAHHEEQ